MTTAVFKDEAFRFEEGEPIPEHIDDHPDRDQRDPDLYHVEGFVPEDGDFFWLAMNLRDEVTAEILQTAAVRGVEAQRESLV